MASTDPSLSPAAPPAAAPEGHPPGTRVAVLLPLPLSGAYDYLVPDGMTLHPGQVVQVPLGRRQEIGVVWGSGDGTVAAARLRAVAAVIDSAPPVPAASRAFVEWVAAYTLAPPGAVLRMVLPVPQALWPVRRQPLYVLAGGDPTAAAARLEARGQRLTPARRRVLAAAEAAPPLGPADLARAAGVGTAVVHGLVAAGVLEPLALDPAGPAPEPDGAHPGPRLSPGQQAAAAGLVGGLDGGFSVTLLEGVTGSGKTEVYFEAVAAALRAGRQVLVLVPEITLTAQWLGRFEARFGAPPLVWHSEVPAARRRRTLRAVAEGRARVVVGARSALFLPYPDLGLIVVDEEHEAAFKQEDGVVYHGRDMAVVRGRVGGCPVVLASATPSLETMANVAAGRYRHLRLPERFAGAALPAVELIDLRKAPPEKGPWGPGWLTPPLVEAVRATLAAGAQAMLFLNRRGYAPLTLCRACGHRLQCPHCSAWLVEHRLHGRLICHHCGHGGPLPEACPACGEPGRLAACGPGVERLAEEAAARFPGARLAVAASDTIPGPVEAAELVRKAAAREIDLLIGTQILAKGLHFPLLTLVGVVDADLGLGGGDLRAAERTFQLLSQVAGRAGRGEHPGRVLLQTCDPGHPVLQAMVAGDGAAFLAAESDARRQFAMPPYGRLVALIVSGTSAEAVESAARALGAAAPRAPQAPGVEVLGPAPAPLALLRGRHRWRLLLKAPRACRVQPLVRAWLAAVRLPGAVRVQVDIDPYSFL